MIEIRAEVIVYDLDDTLYLEKDYAESGYKALSRQFAERIGGARFADECSRLLAEGARNNIFDLALARCRIDATPRLIAELVAAYRAHVPAIGFCGDTLRFFDRVGKEMRTGLITDGPKETQWAKVKALGLGETIDHVVVTGEWPKEFSKPHPRAFELIESLTSAPRRNIVYIADNGAKDFVSPRQLGWQSVQILRPDRIHAGTPRSPDHKADHVIASFDELEVRGVA